MTVFHSLRRLPLQTVAMFVLTVFATAAVSEASMPPEQDSTGTSRDESETSTSGVEQASPEYLLRFKFTTGETLRYQTNEHKTQLAVLQNHKKQDVSKVEQRRVFRVVGLTEEGKAQVTMQFEHVRMEQQTDDNPPREFDSAMAMEDVPSEFQGFARNLRGAAVEYELASTGIEVSAEGIESTPDTGTASFMIPLPTDPVSAGDTWTIHSEVKVRIAKGVKRTIKLLRSYRLESVDNDIATIRFSTSVLSPVRTPTVKTQLIEATPAGELQFDIKAGRLVQRTIRHNKTVFGMMGANTMLTRKSQTVDRLLTTDTDTVTSR